MNKWLQRIAEMQQKYGTTFKTMADVRAFQKKHGLLVDGKIGDQTEAKIKELYDQRPPARGTEQNPIQLPEVTVTAPRVDNRSHLRKIADDFTMNDPVFGKRRQRLVAQNYGEDNPFRQGNDMIANAITDVALTAMTGLGVGNLVKSVAAQGAKSLIPLAATVGGAAVGQQAFDQAVEGATGKTWDEHLARGGMDNYGRALFKPGAWAGSYGAGKAANAMMNGIQNVKPWLENSLPRMTMTSEGAVELQPGQTLTLSGRPVGFQNAGQGNFGYQSRFTTKTGGGRGSAAGQKGRVQSGQSYGQASRGIQERVMGDRRVGKGGTNGETYTNQFSDYTPGTPWSGWLPWGGKQYVPTITPPPEEPPKLNVPEFRLEEFKPYQDPFLKWYAKQPEGTTQTYSGDPVHKPGPYLIKRTNPDPVSTVRLVGDNKGFVVPDSTTVKYNIQLPPQVNVLQGGVPAEAVRSTEKITGYRKGGRLRIIQ